MVLSTFPWRKSTNLTRKGGNLAILMYNRRSNLLTFRACGYGKIFGLILDSLPKLQANAWPCFPLCFGSDFGKDFFARQPDGPAHLVYISKTLILGVFCSGVALLPAYF